jgi:hypothetical protein
MDSSEEQVKTACGLGLLSKRRKASETKILVHNVFWAKEEEGEFHIVWTLKGNK